MSEICQKCLKEDEDRRSIIMSCFYDMDELNLPFEKQIVSDEFGVFFKLRVCKECRARWMEMIKLWFRFNFERDSPNTGIFVRNLGGIFEVTEEEFNKENHV